MLSNIDKIIYSLNIVQHFRFCISNNLKKSYNICNIFFDALINCKLNPAAFSNLEKFVTNYL